MTTHPTLLDIPPAQRGQTTRQKRAAQVVVWRDDYEIYTHHARQMDPPWLAMSMTECRGLLADHGLSYEQKDDGALMIAGYCRLLDDAGVIEYGPTEFQAVGALVSRLECEEVLRR